MKLLFKERMFSWFDSYDIYDEDGYVLYTVRGELAWGHLLRIYDNRGCEVGYIKERVFSWLPRFEMYLDGRYVGSIRKEFSFFRPRFTIDCNGWQVDGDWFGWDYQILDGRGQRIADVSKQLFNWTDTYVIDVRDPNHATCILMLVLAIDAEKCSNND